MEKKSDLKKFFIKLASVTLAIIVVLNVVYNLFLAERLENIDKILSLTDRENKTFIKDKIRNEIERSLKKEKILNEEDKLLLYKFYIKIKEEFKDIEN
tara:strand:- start:2858 stop:3151 length:294 start_codon:yes stop_codon:yes gene_type:complete